jgi:hypothetical protein
MLSNHRQSTWGGQPPPAFGRAQLEAGTRLIFICRGKVGECPLQILLQVREDPEDDLSMSWVVVTDGKGKRKLRGRRPGMPSDGVTPSAAS